MTTATLLRSPLTGARSPGPALAGLAAVVAPARSARVALAGAVASVPPIAALHLDAPSGTSMARTTISDVVVTTPAGEPLFALTAGALAVAGIALVRALAGLSGTAWTRALLAGWALALVAAAVFPTNLPGRPGDTSSTIHLIAGAAVFALLPLAAVRLWRRLARTLADGLRRTLLAAGLVSGALSTALIVNRIPGVLGAADLSLPPGLLQRAAGAAQIVLAALLGLGLLRSRAAQAAAASGS
jgi:hypothetical protein